MNLRRAFTLLELLVALAISAIVMVGACVLMFNSSMAMRYFEEGEPFDIHVNGVEKFLTYSIHNAAYPSVMDANLSETGVSNAKISWGLPPDSVLTDRKKLCFGILEDRPFFISQRGLSPEKIAWLDFREKEGLFILWRFIKNENFEVSNEAPLYESLISAYVTKYEYLYIDGDGRWESTEDSENPPTGIASGSLPNFLKLTFTYGKEEFVRLIALTTPVDSLFAVSDSASSAAQAAQAAQNSSGGRSGGQGVSQ